MGKAMHGDKRAKAKTSCAGLEKGEDFGVTVLFLVPKSSRICPVLRKNDFVWKKDFFDVYVPFGILQNVRRNCLQHLVFLYCPREGLIIE